MWNVDNLYKGYLIYLGMHNQGAAQMALSVAYVATFVQQRLVFMLERNYKNYDK